MNQAVSNVEDGYAHIEVDALEAQVFAQSAELGIGNGVLISLVQVEHDEQQRHHVEIELANESALLCRMLHSSAKVVDSGGLSTLFRSRLGLDQFFLVLIWKGGRLSYQPVQSPFLSSCNRHGVCWRLLVIQSGIGCPV